MAWCFRPLRVATGAALRCDRARDTRAALVATLGLNLRADRVRTPPRSLAARSIILDIAFCCEGWQISLTCGLWRMCEHPFRR